MYKVKDKDVIAKYRLGHEAVAMDESEGGMLTADFTRKEEIYRQCAELQYLIENDYPHNRLWKALYAFIDLVNERMASYAVCGKGCSFCCKVPVHITDGEAHYIEKNTGIKVNPKARKTKLGKNVTAKIAYNEQEHGVMEYIEMDIGEQGSIGYCPLHDPKTATCTAHEFRPYACRNFFTFDNPAHCKDPMAKHFISSNGGGHVNKQVDDLYNMVAYKTSKNKTFQDIRHLFKAK